MYVWRFKTEIVISGINNGFKDITLIDGNVRLIMSIYGNGDLYWTITDDSKLIKNMFFTIIRENGAVYSIFQDLFADIENANVCTLNDDIFNNYETEKYNKIYHEEVFKYDFYHYFELYDIENKTITWCSDEFNRDNANILKIRKIDDEFELEFIPKSILSGFINGSSNIGRVTIKFCNFGSYYAPFNVMFMRLFNKLQLVDDVKDIKHQVSIDEYMYNKNKGKRLVNR